MLATQQLSDVFVHVFRVGTSLGTYGYFLYEANEKKRNNFRNLRAFLYKERHRTETVLLKQGSNVLFTGTNTDLKETLHTTPIRGLIIIVIFGCGFRFKMAMYLLNSFLSLDNVIYKVELNMIVVYTMRSYS